MTRRCRKGEGQCGPGGAESGGVIPRAEEKSTLNCLYLFFYFCSYLFVYVCVYVLVCVCVSNNNNEFYFESTL